MTPWLVENSILLAPQQMAPGKLPPLCSSTGGAEQGRGGLSGPASSLYGFWLQEPTGFSGVLLCSVPFGGGTEVRDSKPVGIRDFGV